MTTSFSVWEKVKKSEDEWWQDTFPTFPHNVQQDITENKGVRPESLRVYGEVVFLLLGLKPCVMITGIGDPSFNVLTSFVDCVIRKSGLLAV